MATVDVAPDILRWALDRADLKTSTKRYAALEAIADGLKKPTMAQLEDFAHATHVPFGYLFLENPPVESVPIPDFRAPGDNGIRVPSANLLDVIYEAQIRQDWYREYAKSQEAEPLEFHASASVSTPTAPVAASIRSALGFDMARRRSFANWEAALRYIIDAIEDIGVLVMVSSVVGNNTHRKLNLDEFRGFTLSDPLASVIFVNGSDTKSGQMFTLIHELAHVWLGETGVSQEDMKAEQVQANERWANAVAAEVLVPLHEIEAEFQGVLDQREVQRLARYFKVSTLVIAKRIFDARLVDWDSFIVFYRAEEGRVRELAERQRKSPGGDFYNSRPLQSGQQFARAVIVDAFEGRTLYRDAFKLLGTSKVSTFEGLARKLGVA